MAQVTALLLDSTSIHQVRGKTLACNNCFIERPHWEGGPQPSLRIPDRKLITVAPLLPGTDVIAHSGIIK